MISGKKAQYIFFEIKIPQKSFIFSTFNQCLSITHIINQLGFIIILLWSLTACDITEKHNQASTNTQNDSITTSSSNPKYKSLGKALDSLAHTIDTPIKADLPPSDIDPIALSLKEEGQNLYYQKNRFDDGIRKIQKALQIDPRIPDAYNTLMQYYLMLKNDPETALKYMERGVKHCPNSPSLRFDLGSVYSQLGRYNHAIEQYKNAEELGWDNQASVFYNMGNAYIRLGQKDDAIAAFRRTLSINDKHYNARRNLIIAYIETDKTILARKEAQRLLELDPDGRFGIWAQKALRHIR